MRNLGGGGGLGNCSDAIVTFGVIGQYPICLKVLNEFFYISDKIKNRSSGFEIMLEITVLFR